MKFTYRKSENKNKNRIEFWIDNFDYVDGIDYIAQIFSEKFGMKISEKIEGIYFDVIKLNSDEIEYHLMWDEDIGTLIYSIAQDSISLERLENELSVVLKCLNEKLKNIP